jgi:superfamily II DNA or RNA helicase
LPDAVKEKLIQIAPADIEKLALDDWYKHVRRKKVELFQHQKEAVESWIRNRMRGIFEMATGTGKTFAALGCLDEAGKTHARLVAIIACPYQHLGQQWRREIEKFGIHNDRLVVADSSNPSWKDVLADSLVDISLGYKNKLALLTTHSTFSSDDFMRIIKNGKSGFSIFLIADEVHGLGAKKRKEGLLEEYDLRLGLSATPKRWFDTIGTNKIYDYFGGTVYEFPLGKAINTINPTTNRTYLAPYRYVPKFISLTAEELAEYIDKTRAIAVRFNKARNEEERDTILENLLFERADILKNAVRKYGILEEILDELGSSLRWTIVYSSPQQINNVMEIINRRRITAHRFTMDEKTTPDIKYNGLSERDFLLQEFAEGKYQVLVAMKCLDEGVDIPQARTTILMASSGNPREYIQRIGRVIRRCPGKNEATIYDILVVPSFGNMSPELREIERKIFEKELDRYEEIARTAINNAEALSLIYEIQGV